MLGVYTLPTMLALFCGILVLGPSTWAYELSTVFHSRELGTHGNSVTFHGDWTWDSKLNMANCTSTCEVGVQYFGMSFQFKGGVNKSSNAGAIAGGVVGGVLGVTVIVLIIAVILRRRRRTSRPLDGSVDDDTFEHMRALDVAPPIEPYGRQLSLTDSNVPTSFSKSFSPLSQSSTPINYKSAALAAAGRNFESEPSSSSASDLGSGSHWTGSASTPSSSSLPPLRSRGVRHEEDAGELEMVPEDNQFVEADEILPPMYNPQWKSKGRKAESPQETS